MRAPFSCFFLNYLFLPSPSLSLMSITVLDPWVWMFSIPVPNCRLFPFHPSLPPSLLFSSFCQSEHLPLHKLPISHRHCLISRLRHSLAPWASARHPGFLLDLLWGCLAGIPKPTHCEAKQPTFVLSSPPCRSTSVSLAFSHGSTPAPTSYPVYLLIYPMMTNCISDPSFRP